VTRKRIPIACNVVTSRYLLMLYGQPMGAAVISSELESALEKLIAFWIEAEK